MPVISFGWVALFILFYILIVGPLDYFLLKKVFKRLELTWITFPTLVLIVSVVAYFTAYCPQGRRPAHQQDRSGRHRPARAPARSYGTTWFTLFSPRIQNYTVGIEPAAPGWAAPAPARPTRRRRR